MKKQITILLLIFALLLPACGQQAPTWQEQYDLGVRYLSEGNYQEAIIAFTAAIEIDPRNPGAYLSRAGAYIASGETEENLSAARADYEEARDIDRSSPEAWLGLADVHIRQEEFDEAQAVLEEALEATGSDPAIVEKLEEMASGSITDASKKIYRLDGYDENGNLAWYEINTYSDDGKWMRWDRYSSDGILGSYDTYEYDEEGRQTRRNCYNADGRFYYGEVYEYNADNRLSKTYCYMSDGTLRNYNINIYSDSGRLLRSEYYSPNGIRDSDSYDYDTYEYDEEGRQTQRNHYGSIISWNEISEYDVDGRLTKLEFIDEQGVFRYDLYFYDQDGAIARTEIYGEDGNLNGTLTYTYIS